MRTFLAFAVTLGLALPAAAQTADELLKSAAGALANKNPRVALEFANKALDADPKHLEGLFFRAGVLEQLDRYNDSAADYTKILALEKAPANAYQFRGLVQFKAGKIKESIADFDKYIELKPQAKISHWQRGISYYYAKLYDDGRKQFEGYQDFDSNDVENAVWRFMCMVRKDGIDKARKEILKIGDDKRVPMRQVYDLYKGDIKPDAVFAACRAGEPDAKVLSQRLFYAHLYVGIYHDLLGSKAAALSDLNKATDEHRIGHYMWDVARVHRDLLAAELKAKQ